MTLPFMTLNLTKTNLTLFDPIFPSSSISVNYQPLDLSFIVWRVVVLLLVVRRIPSHLRAK